MLASLLHLPSTGLYVSVSVGYKYPMCVLSPLNACLQCGCAMDSCVCVCTGSQPGPPSWATPGDRAANLKYHRVKSSVVLDFI